MTTWHDQGRTVDTAEVHLTEREAQADQLAADLHGVASREHDLAMDAHAEYVEEHQIEARRMTAYPPEWYTEADAAAARAEAAEEPPATPAGDFYGWHADNGHAPQWDGAGGVECGTCGESFQPQPQPEPEAG